MFKHRLRDAISNIILVCLVLAGVLLLIALLFPLCSNLIFGSISNKYQAELYYRYEHDEEHDVFYENEEEIGKAIKQSGIDREKLLEAKNRKLAGFTAPPQGLFLWSVSYEGTRKHP